MSAMAWRWLAHTLLGGGLLLLLARWLLVRLGQPARRQRLGEWALAAALLLALLSLAPAWLLVPVPAALPHADAAPVEAGAGPFVLLLPPLQADPVPVAPRAELPPDHAAREAPAPPVAPPPPATPAESGFLTPLWRDLPGLLLTLYAFGAALLAAHWLVGYAALAWLLRDGRPAPGSVARLLREMAGDRSRVRLLVSPRVGVPFSFGLWRPTVVLPLVLVERGGEAELRWVLTHELTHLERRDAWTCLLFGLGQVVYFALPWFWGLRRQVRLSQEYVADAAAAGDAPEEYAQFLLSWANAPALPAGVTGVMGRSSDLFRRVSMLLQPHQPVEKRCPRRWSLTVAAALAAVAVLGAGVGLRAVAANDDTKKDEPKKQDVKKPDLKKDDAKKDAKKDEKKDRVRDPFNLFPDLDKLPDLKGLDAEQRAELHKRLKEMREEMRRALGAARLLPGDLTPLPGGRFGALNRHDARLGAMVQKPSETLVEQLDLPKDQGLIVERVLPDSAAAKAGLKAHDILLELNGKPVPSDPAAFVKELNGIKADTAVDAVVLRKGKKETLKGLKLPEAKKEADVFAPFEFPAVHGVPGNGAMTAVTRTNDNFTVRHKEGGVRITLSGKVEDGKAVPESIEVTDNGKTEKYASVEKVPEAHRAQVQKLLKMAATGQVKAEVKP